MSSNVLRAVSDPRDKMEARIRSGVLQQDENGTETPFVIADSSLNQGARVIDTVSILIFMLDALRASRRQSI
jgi:hypothetical protein